MKDRQVDHSALRTNQVFIITLLLIAFVIDSVWLVAFVGFVMLIGTAVPTWGLFKRIYTLILKPLGFIKPDVIEDNPEPHQFAQGFGGFVIVGAVISLFLSANLLGWVLVWLVLILAGLNLFLGFCVGCFIYYQLSKFGIPGFLAEPLR